MLVYIINQHGDPLMPCSPRKARNLLQQNRAKVIKRTPFTLQLTCGSSGYKQAISLGVDAGSKHIGISATTDKKVLFEAEVAMRTDIQELLSSRREFRRARRNRTTPYREPRFNNRTRKEGWLPPSTQNIVDMHVKVVKRLHSLLPVSNVIVEVAQFDIQKIKSPEIEGVGYQQGDQLGFWNVREYVLHRDKHTCQHCKGKSKDKILNVHHIESRKTGGDSPDNLITLCETCHDKVHAENLTHIFKRRNSSFRDMSQMTVLRWFVYNALKAVYPDVKLTYGYITKHTRIQSHLPKSHMVDARCISGHPLANVCGTTYFYKQVRAHNRQIHKATIRKGGLRQSNIATKCVFGFRLFDKALYQGQECFVFGRRSSGYFDVRLLDGTKVHAGVHCRNLKLIERNNTLLIERRCGAFRSHLPATAA